MNRPSRSQWLIALAWLAAVMGLVRLGEAGFGVWARQRQALSDARERLSRLTGWLAVEEEVSAREQALPGGAAAQELSAIGWIGLQELQSLAREREISVLELRPTELPAQGARQAVVRLDLKLQGTLAAMAPFLQQIPDRLRGVRLETLQLLPQAGGAVQALLRLHLPGEKRS
jgi:hypothetical protein